MSSMTPTQRARQRRAAKARRLHDSGMSVRAVARELRVAHTTILKDLSAPAPEHALEPPPNGNSRALRIGDGSPRVIEPIRKRILDEVVRVRWPHADAVRATLLADRLAKFEVIQDYLDENGLFNPDRAGELWACVERQDKYATRVEHLIAELDAERSDSPEADATVLAEALGDGDE